MAQAFGVSSVPVQVVSTDVVALAGKVEFTVSSGTPGAGVVVLAYGGVDDFQHDVQRNNRERHLRFGKRLRVGR